MRDGNGLVEDIGAEIGFTATIRLVALFSGKKIYIPERACPGHQIAMVIGERCMNRLVAAFGGQNIDIPNLAEYDNLRLLPGLARRITAGESTKDIARSVGFTEQHVRRLRVEAEDLGLLPRVMHQKTVGAPAKPTRCGERKLAGFS